MGNNKELNNENTKNENKENTMVVIEKENWFVRTGRKIKTSYTDFKEKHPKVVKGLKIGAAVGAGALAVGVGVKIGKTKKEVVSEETMQVFDNLPDMIETTEDILAIPESVETIPFEEVAETMTDVVDTVAEVVTE